MENLKVVQFDFGFKCEPISAKEKVVTPTKKDKNDFVFDFMDCLASPIIVFKSAWQDTIPKRHSWKDKIITFNLHNDT